MYKYTRPKTFASTIPELPKPEPQLSLQKILDNSDPTKSPGTPDTSKSNQTSLTIIASKNAKNEAQNANLLSPAAKGRSKKSVKIAGPTQEEIMHRKFVAKCRFRGLVRLVIANLYWLTQEEEIYEGDNVKRRVEQAMRAKKAKSENMILGLAHVKRKLAAATYFKYYGPNRVIVRQHQDAHALYFILTGEVIVSIIIYDELLQKHVSIDVFVMHSGDMFGEVSLLHNIPRTATCTTVGDCEFLALMKQDFKNVLQVSLQKQWDEVTLAMTRFSYFQGLDQVSLREGCIVSKMKSFEPNEIILGDGRGLQNFVYFVLSGRCQMIETLQIITNTNNGKKSFKLYDPYVPKETSELELEEKYFKDLPKEPQNISSDKTSTNSDKVNKIKDDTKSSRYRLNSRVSHQVNSQDDDESFKKHGERHHLLSQTQVLLPFELRTSFKFDPMPNMKTHFMQVCIFNPGSTFGFGENMRDRRIVSLTRVDCMMMPLVWLLSKNTNNIWTRIQHYLETKIPTKQQLFKEFVAQHQWQKYRDKLVEDIVSRSSTVNHTTLHDVPYSTRMEHMFDI